MKYKYLGSDEYSLKPVTDKSIKYSTLRDLNDPFEATQAVRQNEEVNKSFFKEDFSEMTFGSVTRMVPRFLEQARSVCPVEHQSEIEAASDKPVIEVLTREQMTAFENRVCETRHQTFFTSIEQDAQKALDHMMGILCLSNTCENYLMWSHYADKHRGYCIGFDDHNPWFNPLRAGKPDCRCKFHDSAAAEYLGCLRQVDYFSHRLEMPEKASLVNSFTPFFHKAKDWLYEDEYRMLYPLKCSENASEVTAASLKFPHAKLIRHGELYLRKFPVGLIKEIVFGVRCSLDTQSKIRTALAGCDVAYYFAIPSSVDYTMKKEPALFDYAYAPLNQELI